MPQANQTGDEVQTLRIEKDLFIAAAPEIVWESVLEEVGPQMCPRDEVMPMTLEAWPGGRWWRDLGNKQGHLWGHVQVIKPPKVLEICGPMFMSYPAMNHLQYRLAPERDGTRFKLIHRGFGLLDAEQLKGADQGWGNIAENIRKSAEKRASR
jgi:uncharacterized protein YndB with AHSA1/START domain